MNYIWYLYVIGCALGFVISLFSIATSSKDSFVSTCTGTVITVVFCTLGSWLTVIWWIITGISAKGKNGGL